MVAGSPTRLATACWPSFRAPWMPSNAPWRFRISWQRRAPEIPEDRRLQFRIGIHVGDVVVRGGDLLGDGVNVAARLEGFAEPGGIAISGAAHGYVRKALPLAYTDLGEQHVKNIDEPVRAYSVGLAVATAPLPSELSAAR